MSADEYLRLFDEAMRRDLAHGCSAASEQAVREATAYALAALAAALTAKDTERR